MILTVDEANQLICGDRMTGSDHHESGRQFTVHVVRPTDHGGVFHGRVSQQVLLDVRRHHLDSGDSHHLQVNAVQTEKN